MNATSIVVGGIIPALFLGLGAVLMRSSIAAGARITDIGCGRLGDRNGADLVHRDRPISYGFGTLKLPVAVVAPLTNANALVAVAVGALAFGEWRSLHLPMTVGGTLLICVGATLVSLSK